MWPATMTQIGEVDGHPVNVAGTTGLRGIGGRPGAAHLDLHRDVEVATSRIERIPLGLGGDLVENERLQLQALEAVFADQFAQRVHRRHHAVGRPRVDAGDPDQPIRIPPTASMTASLGTSGPAEHIALVMPAAFISPINVSRGMPAAHPCPVLHAVGECEVALRHLGHGVGRPGLHPGVDDRDTLRRSAHRVSLSVGRARARRSSS